MIKSKRVLFSIKISFIAASISTVLALIFAIPVAYGLSRWEFKGKNFIDTILEFPMVVSPAALGALILIFFNTPMGMWIQNHTTNFIFTIYGIILAQFFTVLGIAIRLIKATMDEIPTRYEDVARSIGVPPWKVFFTITLPLSKKGIIAGTILTWAKAMGEFGATITIGGTMAMKTETLPIAIFMRLSTADIEGTVILIFLLLFLGLGTLFFIRILLK